MQKEICKTRNPRYLGQKIQTTIVNTTKDDILELRQEPICAPDCAEKHEDHDITAMINHVFYDKYINYRALIG